MTAVLVAVVAPVRTVHLRHTARIRRIVDPPGGRVVVRSEGEIRTGQVDAVPDLIRPPLSRLLDQTLLQILEGEVGVARRDHPRTNGAVVKDVVLAGHLRRDLRKMGPLANQIKEIAAKSEMTRRPRQPHQIWETEGVVCHNPPLVVVAAKEAGAEAAPIPHLDLATDVRDRTGNQHPAHLPRTQISNSQRSRIATEERRGLDRHLIPPHHLGGHVLLHQQGSLRERRVLMRERSVAAVGIGQIVGVHPLVVNEDVCCKD